MTGRRLAAEAITGDLQHPASGLGFFVGLGNRFGQSLDGSRQCRFSWLVKRGADRRPHHGPVQQLDRAQQQAWSRSRQTCPPPIGIYDNEEFGPLRLLIWSPEPGVVLELSVVAERWNLDDTIALAEGVTMVTLEQWNLRYPG